MNNGVLLLMAHPVPFNTPGVQFGNVIRQIGPTTFSISQPGYYKVDFTLYTAVLSLLGTVTVEFTGMATPHPAGNPFSLAVAGVGLTGQLMFQATTSGTIQLIITGIGLTLAATNTNAIIIIEKLA
ncbi:BclA protein [Paenibacillus sp. N1-5-1-14]|nr:BclA protein [Paenibacillus radicibacter]